MIPAAQMTADREPHADNERPPGEPENRERGWLPSWLRRSLQSRLTVLMLAVTIPLLAGMIVFLTVQARNELVKAANQTLNTVNSSVTETTRLWLEYNRNALQTLVNSPDIATMNSLWQRPMLQEMAATYPYMYLVSATDVNGINRARSDAQAMLTYSDRAWFKNAIGGAPITFETLIGKTSKQPSLVVSMPIRQRGGTPSSSGSAASEEKIVGVGMFAVQLDQLTNLVSGVELGRGGSALIVDQNNLLLVSTEINAVLLTNLDEYPPVKALRAGQSGAFSFINANGERLQAAISTLPNGWGVIAQQTEAGMFAPINQFQLLALIILVVGGLAITLLTWSSIRQALHPIQELTQAASAISAGDLSRQATEPGGPPDSQDELGLLARSFNLMTAELRELVGGLENRVAERTHLLERRALQFQVTAEVAREAAAIRDPERLLQNVVNLISDRFSYDHTGIFLLEQGASEQNPPSGEMAERGLTGEKPGFAILRAASSEGGQYMVAHGHRLRIGQQGIVGFVAATGQSRIALDVGQDAVFFNNPALPLTHSEMALPLKVQNRVIGVLDVQSNQSAAFSEEDLSILQILADQLALAIENARLLMESQQSVRELESLYGIQIRQGWNKRLSGAPMVYTFDRQSEQVRQNTLPESVPPKRRRETPEEQDAGQTIRAPIELRGQRIGNLYLHRRESLSGARSGEWSAQAQEAAQDIASQLALALENARLMEEIQNRASQEALLNRIVARMQSSVNLESVMKTAVTEIGRTMHLARIELRLDATGESGNLREASEEDSRPTPLPPNEQQGKDVGSNHPPAHEEAGQ